MRGGAEASFLAVRGKGCYEENAELPCGVACDEASGATQSIRVCVSPSLSAAPSLSVSPYVYYTHTHTYTFINIYTYICHEWPPIS